MKTTIAFCFSVLLLSSLCIGCGSGGEAVTASIEAPAKGQRVGPESEQPVALSATSMITTAAENPAAQTGEELYPEVVVKTSLGEFTIQLDAEKAPVTVDNFLRNYVERGFYENTIFHYVEDGYIASAGGYTTAGEAKPTRTEIRNEAHNGLKNVRGSLAMARGAEYIHSATSQFWVNLADNPFLDYQLSETSDTATADPNDYGYCVFGKVISGMDVIDLISKTPVHDTEEFAKLPQEPVIILSMRRTK